MIKNNDALCNSVICALGVCRVGLLGAAKVMKSELRQSGVCCPENGPFDAWFTISTLEELAAGEGLPIGNQGGPIFVVCRLDSVGPAVALRSRIENVMIRRGYVKHPATYDLFGYEALDESLQECWALFDFRPALFGHSYSAQRLESERDLRSDMLREPGVRSDAHLVRYQLAAGLVRPGDSVLDAACGLGYGSHLLASLSPATGVTGIDASRWAVDYAKLNYGGHKAEFICGSLPDALNNVPDCSFDFVVSLATLEHVADPAKLLATFERVLKPGGRIFVSVPNVWADEMEEDPNPRHFHVYDWARLRRELDAHFIVESAWSLTASGCKTGPKNKWRPQPRKLGSIALDEAANVECEWWLVCASKSPLKNMIAPYGDARNAKFEGYTHLVDFAEYYDRPWIVPSMIEIPWRIRDKTALLGLAKKLEQDAPKQSADKGAALVVIGWRIIESYSKDNLNIKKWFKDTYKYISFGATSANPHIRRWCVSLNYVRARLYELQGDVVAAVAAYQAVVLSEVQSITPTLGTKQADAALRAGFLCFRNDNIPHALQHWNNGLKAVFSCLQADPLEFLGNSKIPFVFAMNDLVEIADGAARLANAIHAVNSHSSAEKMTIARQLGSVSQRSLRSALDNVQKRVEKLIAELLQANLRIGHTQTALEEAQTFASLHHETLGNLAQQLELTERAKASAEELAHAHLSEVHRLQVQLTATEDAKLVAETLAMARHEELTALAQQLDRTEQVKSAAEELAHAHLSEVHRLQVQLTATEDAKLVAETLAMARHEELLHLEKQLSLTISENQQLKINVVFKAAELNKIQKSLSYKFLSLIHLAPRRNEKNV
jgi:2-polyprenyl-3-methyl-5-hydroxy-6-metoxy-1,4-benzoquinol methylase